MKSVAPKTVNLRRLATTWLVALAVVGVAELVVRARPAPEYVADEELLIAFQRDKLAVMPEGAVLLLGDSTLGSDVDAEVASRALGVPVVNAALVATFTTVGDCALLEYALEHGKKLRAVVLFHASDTWGRPFSTDHYQLLQRTLGQAGFETLAGDAARTLELARQAPARRITAFGNRYGLDWKPERLAKEIRDADDARAGLPELDYMRPQPVKDWPNVPVTAEARPFFVDGHVEQWLDRTLDLAHAHGIPVWIAVGPTRTGKVRVQQQYMSRALAWLESRSEDGERFRLLWHATLVAPDDTLGDNPQHLSLDAKRTRFTPWFAERLRSALAGRDDGPRAPFWDPFADREQVFEPGTVGR